MRVVQRRDVAAGDRAAHHGGGAVADRLDDGGVQDAGQRLVVRGLADQDVQQPAARPFQGVGLVPQQRGEVAFEAAGVRLRAEVGAPSGRRCPRPGLPWSASGGRASRWTPRPAWRRPRWSARRSRSPGGPAPWPPAGPGHGRRRAAGRRAGCRSAGAVSLLSVRSATPGVYRRSNTKRNVFVSCSARWHGFSHPHPEPGRRRRRRPAPQHLRHPPHHLHRLAARSARSAAHACSPTTATT